MPTPVPARASRRVRAIEGALLALASTGLLAACSAGSAGSPSTAPAAAVSTSTGAAPTSAPPPAAAAAVQGVAHIKDADGYTFDVAYALTPLAYAKDVASEKPGYNTIRISLRTSLTVANTTTGRTLSFQPVTGVINGEPKVELEAYWARSSPVCKALNETSRSRCGITMAFTRPGTELAADATSTGETYAGFIGLAPGLSHVPDASYDAVLAALKHPAGYDVTYAGYDNIRFKDTCTNPDLEQVIADAAAPGSAVEFYNAGIIPIYDTSGTCATVTVLTQPANE